MIVCPRCRGANPTGAAFCHHDGIPLAPSVGNAGPRPLEWAFPSGRRCTSLDELAAGCLAEWSAARDCLRTGRLRRHFEDCGRDDLAGLADSAAAQSDDNIALQTLLEGLPGLSISVRPLADPSPRRFNLEQVHRNEVRLLPLKFLNRGSGYLHGTVSVVEGERWLWLGEGVAPTQTCRFGTKTEQTITIQIDPGGLPAIGSYLGKLRLESNGGNLEIPVQTNLVFRTGQFMGHAVGSEKELARLLRDRPRDAITWLQDGAVREWYAQNHLPFPVIGAIAPQLAGIQQYFECAGFSRPPEVASDVEQIVAICTYPETVTRSIELTTHEKKWLYAFVQSESVWLKPRDSVAAGPQRAGIVFDIDSGLMEPGRAHESALRVIANGGQSFRFPIVVEVRRANEPFTRRLLRPFFNG